MPTVVLRSILSAFVSQRGEAKNNTAGPVRGDLLYAGHLIDPVIFPEVALEADVVGILAILPISGALQGTPRAQLRIFERDVLYLNLVLEFDPGLVGLRLNLKTALALYHLYDLLISCFDKLHAKLRMTGAKF